MLFKALRFYKYLAVPVLCENTGLSGISQKSVYSIYTELGL
jgi:hypothetical protein